MDDVGNGRIETGNSMVDRVPDREPDLYPAPTTTRMSQH